MIPENKFQSPIPEKVPNCANVPPGKIEKIIINRSPGLLHLYACANKKWNSPFSWWVPVILNSLNRLGPRICVITKHLTLHIKPSLKYLATDWLLIN